MQYEHGNAQEAVFYMELSLVQSYLLELSTCAFL